MQTKLAQLSGANSFVIEVLASISLALVVYYSVGRFTPGEFAAFVGNYLSYTGILTIILVLLGSKNKITSSQCKPWEE